MSAVCNAIRSPDKHGGGDQAQAPQPTQRVSEKDGRDAEAQNGRRREPERNIGRVKAIIAAALSHLLNVPIFVGFRAGEASRLLRRATESS
jgi:hypothetical protein